MTEAGAGPAQAVPASEAKPSMRAAWVAVFVLMVLYVAAYLDRQVINLLIDEIREDLGATDVQMSFLQGFAFVLSFVLCGLPVGWAVDRYPRRWIVFVGVIAWSAAAAAAGLSKTFGHMLWARLGVGAGESALMPSAYSLFADLFPKDRLAVPMGVFSIGATIGMAISLAAGGLIVGWANEHGAVIAPVVGLLKPWQLVLLITSAPGFILAFLVFVISEPPRTQRTALEKTQGIGLVAQLRRYPGFYLCHFGGFAILCVVAQAWNSWSPTMLVRTLGWSVPQAGGLLALLSVTGVIGQLGAAAIADALLRRGVTDAHFRIYMIGSLIIAVAGVVTALAARSGAVWLMSGAIVVVYVCMNFIAVAASALQIVTPAHLRGQMSTVFLLIYNVLGYGLGPFVVAMFTEYVFHDPAKIALSIAWSFAIFGPIAALLFALGLRPFRRAMAA